MLKNITASALLLLSLTAQADDSLLFNYVDVGYNSLDFEFSRLSGGAEFKFSKTLGQGFYLAGDVAETTEGGGRLVVKTFGLGYRFDISSSAVFFSEVDFADVHRDHGDGVTNLDGYELTLGIKRQMTKEFVGLVGLEQLNLEHYNDTSILIGGAYGVSQSFSIYVEGRVLSDSQRYSTGIRYNF